MFYICYGAIHKKCKGNHRKIEFEIADESYAVENALDEVKKIATGVIGSNNDDSVAAFLRVDVKIAKMVCDIAALP